MRILLLGKGTIPARFNLVSINCENWINKNMGEHEFLTFGYNDGVDIKIKVSDSFDAVIDQLPNGWIPDFCLLWEVDWNLLPKGIEEAPFPTVAIAWDWDYDILFSKAIFKTTDLVIALSDFEMRAIKAVGAANVDVFYFIGVMKEYFAPMPKKMRDRRYDILYTTWIDDITLSDRSRWILRLCSLSDKYNVCICDPITNYAEYNKLLSNAKLVLSHHRYGSMSGRVLEAGAQGTVTLETGKEIEKHFTPDEEYIPITPDNFDSKVEMYLRNESILEDMSYKIYSKVSEKFDARKRFLNLLELIKERVDKKILERKCSSESLYEKHLRRGEIFYYSFFRTPNYILDGRKILLKESIGEFKKAVRIDASARAMTNLAIAVATYGFLFERERFVREKAGEAVSILKQVIYSYPEYAIAYFHLGIFNFRIKNFKEARYFFFKAYKLFEETVSNVDPLCLYLIDFEEYPLRKALNKNLLKLCEGLTIKALKEIRKLYQAASAYYLYIIEEEVGSVSKALEFLMKSYELNAGCGLVAKRAARLLAVLGFKEKSIKLYRDAITLLPLDIGLRLEFTGLLYFYEMDEEASEELNRIINITEAVRSFKKFRKEIKELIEYSGRFNVKGEKYRHKSYKERILINWSIILIKFMQRDDLNVHLILRLIDILEELKRVDMILRVVKYLVDRDVKSDVCDIRKRTLLKKVYYRLEEIAHKGNLMGLSRLEKLKELFEKTLCANKGMVGKNYLVVPTGDEHGTSSGGM